MQCKSRARIERSNGSLEIRFVHADLQGKRCTRAWQTRVNKFRRVCNATLKRTYRHCNRFNWTIPVSVNYYSWRAAIVPRSSIDRSISPIWWKIINRGGNSREMIEIEERQIEFPIRYDPCKIEKLDAIGRF